MIRKVELAVFLLTIIFYLTNWNYVLYPFFTNDGTLGNSIAVIILSIIFGICNSLSIHIFLKLKFKLRVIYAILALLMLPLSSFFENVVYGNGDYLRDVTNWQINIYFFDQGMFYIFLTTGMFCIMVFIIGYLLSKLNKSII